MFINSLKVYTPNHKASDLKEVQIRRRSTFRNSCWGRCNGRCTVWWVPHCGANTIHL